MGDVDSDVDIDQVAIDTADLHPVIDWLRRAQSQIPTVQRTSDWQWRTGCPVGDRQGPGAVCVLAIEPRLHIARTGKIADVRLTAGSDAAAGAGIEDSAGEIGAGQIATVEKRHSLPGDIVFEFDL